MYEENIYEKSCVYELVWRQCTVAARATKIYTTKQGLEFKTSEMPEATPKKTGRILSNTVL
jgi:hypothetical protein